MTEHDADEVWRGSQAKPPFHQEWRIPQIVGTGMVAAGDAFEILRQPTMAGSDAGEFGKRARTLVQDRHDRCPSFRHRGRMGGDRAHRGRQDRASERGDATSAIVGRRRDGSCGNWAPILPRAPETRTGAIPLIAARTTSPSGPVRSQRRIPACDCRSPSATRTSGRLRNRPPRRRSPFIVESRPSRSTAREPERNPDRPRTEIPELRRPTEPPPNLRLRRNGRRRRDAD